MEEVIGISHLGFRAIIDGLEEILGVNGTRALLRYTGFQNLIEHPLEYDMGSRMELADTNRLFKGIREIVGDKGYNSLMYRSGTLTIKSAHAHSEVVQSIVNSETTPEEKIKQLYSLYLGAIGLNLEQVVEFFPEKKELLIHRVGCYECGDIYKNREMCKDITRPGCATILGGTYQVGNLRPDLVTAEAEEIKCRLLGHDECLFRVTYEPKK
jgi:hypothetical protein